MEIFDQDELDFLNAPYVGETFTGLEKTLADPLFTISNFDLSARDASYWEEKDILPMHCGAGKRRMYNLVQGAWIKLAQQLRTLGVPTETIKKLKINLLQEQISLNEVLKNKKAKQALELYLRSIGEYEAFEKAKDDPEVLQQSDKPMISLFATMVKHCVIFRKPFALMVFPDGTFLPNNMKTLADLNEKYENIDDILNTPHSVVSISKAYQQLVLGWKEQSFFPDLGIISNNEKKVLASLRLPDLKSVEVIYKNQKIDLLKVCQEQKVTPAHRLSDIISKNGYHNIVIHTANGKPMYFENKILKKIKH